MQIDQSQQARLIFRPDYWASGLNIGDILRFIFGPPLYPLQGYKAWGRKII